MDKQVITGRVFFAIALLGLGLEHFIYQDFITGRAPPWPEGLPGQLVWAWISGGVVIVAALAILTRRHARLASVILALMVAGWALLRHIPVIAASEVLSPAWTHTVKALALTGGALAMAATFPQLTLRSAALSRVLNSDAAFILTARICLAVFMVNNGIQHFLYTDFVASLIPAWFPGNPYFWTYFASAALFAGALGMLFPPTARLAALLTAVMVFSWVWIVHVPRVFVSRSDNISVFEALAISAIALVLAGTSGFTRSTSRATS